MLREHQTPYLRMFSLSILGAMGHFSFCSLESWRDCVFAENATSDFGKFYLGSL